jgi:ribosomal-protein-alanine N-acetyltransferase
VAPELLVRGPSLALRYPTLGDAPGLFALASDPEVTRFFSWGPYRHEREAEAWLATLPERRARAIALELAIADRDDQAIGITLLSELNLRDRRAVVGTWLGRRHWGTGANREVKGLIAQLAFGPLDLERLGAYADLDNPRSRKALERLGFRQEGVLRAFHRHDDQPHDVAVYALLRQDWQRTRLAQVPAQISGAIPPAWRHPNGTTTATERMTRDGL